MWIANLRRLMQRFAVGSANTAAPVRFSPSTPRARSGRSVLGTGSVRRGSLGSSGVGVVVGSGSAVATAVQVKPAASCAPWYSLPAPAPGSDDGELELAALAGLEPAEVEQRHRAEAPVVDGEGCLRAGDVEHEQRQAVGQPPAAHAHQLAFRAAAEPQRAGQAAGVGDPHRSAGLLVGPHPGGDEDRGTVVRVGQREVAGGVAERDPRGTLAGAARTRGPARAGRARR